MLSSDRPRMKSGFSLRVVGWVTSRLACAVRHPKIVLARWSVDNGVLRLRGFSFVGYLPNRRELPRCNSELYLRDFNVTLLQSHVIAGNY